MEILLVEDDPVTAELISAYLKGLGHSVGFAGDAESAWRRLQGRRYPVIISDWALPGMSGLDLCARIRARAAGEYAYFILITSYHGQGKLAEAMDAGVDDFLPKPVDHGILGVRLRVAQRILDFHQQIRLLKDLLPICMYCKKIRNDHAFWQSVESYFTAQVGADFTHSLCPDCYETHIRPQLDSLRGDAD